MPRLRDVTRRLRVAIGPVRPVGPIGLAGWRAGPDAGRHTASARAALDRSWGDVTVNPWAAPSATEGAATVRCNICRWNGDAFVPPDDADADGAGAAAARCPRCGSVTADRLLFCCFVARTPPALGLRLLEAGSEAGSGLDDAYRRAMARWFDYRHVPDAGPGRPDPRLRRRARPRRVAEQWADVVLVHGWSPPRGRHAPEQVAAEIERILAPDGSLYRLATPTRGPDDSARRPAADELEEALASRGWQRTTLVTGCNRQHRASGHDGTVVAEVTDVVQLGGAPASGPLAREYRRA